MDDATLGKLLNEAHREHADYRSPEGVSVSQSSLSVVFDRRIRGTLLQTLLQADSTRDDAESKNDFWFITGGFIHRHHVEPRVKLSMPREESFPFSVETHRRHQNNTYVTGCIVGKHFEDHWNVDGER